MRLSAWWIGLIPRERTTITLALALISASIALTRLAPTWHDWVEGEHRRLVALSDTLSQLSDVTSSRARRLDSIRVVRLSAALSRVAQLQAHTEEEAALAAMDLVAAAADDVGIGLSSIQRYREASASPGGKPKSRGSFSTVSVQATGVTDPNLIPELLAFLDTSRVQLATRSVSISAATQAVAQRAQEVRFEIVVAAAIRLVSATRAQVR